MPNPLTYERALEEAQRLDLPIWGDDAGASVRSIALLVLTHLEREASDEVCVCGHYERTHSLMEAMAKNVAEEKCCNACPGKFLSRAEFLRGEIEKEKA